jgi:hypothetical protein
MILPSGLGYACIVNSGRADGANDNGPFFQSFEACNDIGSLA